MSVYISDCLIHRSSESELSRSVQCRYFVAIFSSICQTLPLIKYSLLFSKSSLPEPEGCRFCTLWIIMSRTIDVHRHNSLQFSSFYYNRNTRNVDAITLFTCLPVTLFLLLLLLIFYYIIALNSMFMKIKMLFLKMSYKLTPCSFKTPAF